MAATTRLFFLSKGGVRVPDSRRADGLDASVSVLSVAASDGGSRVRVRVENTGANRWLPSGPDRGAVLLGAHRYDADGTVVDLDAGHFHLPGEGLRPGESVEIEISLAPLRPDSATGWTCSARASRGSPSVGRRSARCVVADRPHPERGRPSSGPSTEERAVAERDAAHVAAGRDPRRRAPGREQTRDGRAPVVEHGTVDVGHEAAQGERRVDEPVDAQVDDAVGRLERRDPLGRLVEARGPRRAGRPSL